MNQGPLYGVRVLDLSLMYPGPTCAMHLAAMGADVIKIEPPKMGDMIRQMGEPIFASANRSKRSLALSIKKKEGREILLRLLESADILLEGFKPGLMESLGLGYDDLKLRFPKLIYCHISGYGMTGPYSKKMGHDLNFIALAGLLDLNGPKDGAPVIPGFQTASIAGGSQIALIGILAALFARVSSGHGQFIDVSMLDAAMAQMSVANAERLTYGEAPKRGDSILSGKLPNYCVYKCKDGRYIAVGALERRYFDALLIALNRQDLMKQNELEFIKAELASLFLTKTQQQWCDELADYDVCVSPVLTLEQAFGDPHIQARNMAAGSYIGSPFKMSQTPCGSHKQAPKLGEHTREILQESGFSGPEIDDFCKKRVVQ